MSKTALSCFLLILPILGFPIHSAYSMVEEGPGQPCSCSLRGIGQRSPLNCAIEDQDFELLKALIDQGVPVGARELHRVIERVNPSLEIIRLLLDTGVDVNSFETSPEPDSERLTPLYKAALANRETNGLAVVELLVQRGARINPTPENDFLAPILWAIDPIVIEYLLKEGARLDVFDSTGSSALHHTARYYSLGSLALLAEKAPFLINQSNKKGKTPLHSAVESRDLEKVRFLLEKGANPAASDQNGMTPLLLAAKQYSFEIVQLLSEKSDPAVHRDKMTNSALHWLMMYGSKNQSSHDELSEKLVETIELLIAKGLLNQKNSDGRTALSYAVEKGKGEIAKFLVRRGADPFAKDNGGRDPLCYNSSRSLVANELIEMARQFQIERAHELASGSVKPSHSQYDLTLPAGSSVLMTTDGWRVLFPSGELVPLSLPPGSILSPGAGLISVPGSSNALTELQTYAQPERSGPPAS